MLLSLMRMTLISVVLVFASVLIRPAYAQNSCQSFAPITFGILPFISAEQLVVRFTPLVNYLSEKLKTQVRIETAPNFAEFAHRTQQGQRYDILFTAPHFYLQANQVGYKLIASVDSPGMSAVIVVPIDSKIKTLNDLKHKRLASLHSNSLSSLLLRKHLLKNGINPDKDLTIVITPTHDASLLSSYHGVTDASALMQPPYEAASQQVRDSMRIIATTERAPHIPISISSRISQDCANEISKILLNMSAIEAGKIVLKNNHFSGFRKTKLNEYQKLKLLLAQ